MSQVLAAMRRQIPAARALLKEIEDGTHQASILGSMKAETVADLLRKFIAAMEKRDHFGAVALWAKLAPVLNAAGKRGPGQLA